MNNMKTQQNSVGIQRHAFCNIDTKPFFLRVGAFPGNLSVTRSEDEFVI
jgi:hypothetical protein